MSSPCVPQNIFGDSSSVREVAAASISTAERYISSLGQLSLQLQPPVIDPIFPFATTAPAVSVDALPATQTIVWTAPAVPAPFSGGVDVSSLFPQPFDEDPPSLIFPSPPAVFSGAVPASPPIDLNFVYPTVAVDLPAAPDLLSLQTVTFGGLVMPTIDTTLPVLTAVAPSVIPYVPGAMYTSALLTALVESLDDRIVNGGTGLPAGIEANIWNRARERELRAAGDAIMELERMEATGFMFPTGAYNDSRIKIQTEMGYTISGLSRDIAIKQAELEQSNILAALNTAVGIESKLIDNTNSVEQRIFESTKYATEAAIAIYNAAVQVFQAYIEAYKTKVQIYDAQIRGALATVEVYKTQIEAEKVKADVNTTLVQQYKVHVDAALAVIEVYKTQVQIIQTQAEIEKIKVQVFGEQIRAYTGQIGAYTAQVEGYRASLQAETAKEEVYKTQVEAYSALVGAAVKESEALIEQYKGRIQAKISEYEGYKAQIDGQVGQAKAIADSNQSVAALYSAQVGGKSAYNETLTKQWQVALDQAERVVEIGVSAAKANAELYMTSRSLALDASKVGAQVNAQLGAAALSAISWSTSANYSASCSESVSSSISTSHSDSIQYSYINSQTASV